MVSVGLSGDLKLLLEAQEDFEVLANELSSAECGIEVEITVENRVASYKK